MGDWLYRMYLVALFGAALGFLLWIDSAVPPLYPQETRREASPDCIMASGIEMCGDLAFSACVQLREVVVSLRESGDFEKADWLGAKDCARFWKR